MSDKEKNEETPKKQSWADKLVIPEGDPRYGAVIGGIVI